MESPFGWVTLSPIPSELNVCIVRYGAFLVWLLLAFTTCCCLCIYVAYWSSYTLLSRTTVSFPGLYSIGLTQILGCFVHGIYKNLSHFYTPSNPLSTGQLNSPVPQFFCRLSNNILGAQVSVEVSPFHHSFQQCFRLSFRVSPQKLFNGSFYICF